MKIHKGVPIPDRKAPGGRNNHTPGRVKFPWPRMEVGDCLIFDDRAEYRNAVSCATQYKTRHPEFNYVARTIGGSYHIWRIEPES